MTLLDKDTRESHNILDWRHLESPSGGGGAAPSLKGFQEDIDEIGEVFGLTQEVDSGQQVLALPSKVNLHRAYKEYRYDPKGSRRRRAFNIRAYIGLNGAGKSLLAVHDLLPSIAEGRSILSTVRILDPHTGNAHPNYEKLNDWEQLLNTKRKGYDILFDEVQGIANSRASAGLPIQCQTALHQLRRQDATLSWTSPSWSRADLLIREVTRAVTVCRGYFPGVRKHEDGSIDIRSWGDNRLFRAITYDAADMQNWTDNAETKLSGKQNNWFLRPAMGPWGKPMLASHFYDSLDTVDRIGEVLDAGTCAHCGGTRARKKCSCEDYTNSKESGHSH